uniref:hypothetical protein n=1 Tax=Cupriavidus gilardii TaxID=82541 RepID=UPI002479E381|nr:hypothetical protein [Cupriavidus gilardii]WDE72656.1 hypothetical protein [Cupriavidus gilardii]
MTAYDLLCTCPDDQIIRMQLVWKAVAAGEWKDAAHHLRNAAAEGETPWRARCARLAELYEARA